MSPGADALEEDAHSPCGLPQPLSHPGPITRVKSRHAPGQCWGTTLHGQNLLSTDFLQALEVGDGQGSLVCYSPWGHKELDMTD